MKKTAVFIYDSYCNFEICVALEGLKLRNKEVVFFSQDKNLIKSEEGLIVMPDKSLDELDIDEFDSLLLPGAEDIAFVIGDDRVLEFIKQFQDKIIGAISIAPILLVKAGLLKGKSFMAGVNREDLLEEGFTEDELSKMVEWDECIRHPIDEGFVVTDNIVTSVSFHFVRFSLQFCKMLGIDISPQSFGL